MKTIDQLVEKALSRRSFMVGAGAIAASTAVIGCSDNGTVALPSSSSGSYTDADILNFALNLEYLEAEFYLRAATGTGLPSTMITGTVNGTVGTTGTPGAVTAPTTTKVASSVTLTAAQQNIINEIAYDEQQHVADLRAALGSAAVCRPAIDLTFFPTLATAAGIAGGANFSPFTSFNNFLIGAFIFEDVGVTAYHGAAGLISATGDTNGTLAAAASILSVEAYHAAYVRTAITGADITGGAASLITIANQVATLRAALGGGNETQLTFPTSTGLGTPASTSKPSAIVAADTTNAIAFGRNTDQVHHIVYGSATVGVSKGGFFPAGTNSIFSVTKS